MAFGQGNLVVDPSFEDFRNCNSGILSKNSKFPLRKWTVPNMSTADYYNNCEGDYYQPRTGEGYVAIIIQKKWFEYIQTKISVPLKKDSLYYLEFYVKLSPKSKHSVKGLGACLTEEKVSQGNTLILTCKAQVISNDYVKETEDWVKISGEFRAEGGEQYLTLGCFSSDKTFKRVKTKDLPKEPWAYYFLEDVLLKPVFNSITPDTNEVRQDSNLSVLDSVTVGGVSDIKKDVFFATSSWEISSDMQKELDALLDEIKSDRIMKIEVEGHTDDIGNKIDNMNLSEKRAISVKKYLIENGISESQIKCSAHGSNKPISDNDIDENRNRNRRVTLTITYK